MKEAIRLETQRPVRVLMAKFILGEEGGLPGVEGLGSCGLLAGSGQKQEWGVGRQWRGTGGSWGGGLGPGPHLRDNRSLGRG